LARPYHIPTKAMRDTVTLHTLVGTPQETLCTVLGISPRTLRKHYRSELDTSVANANAKIGGALYNKAINGDTSAQMFWLKTRAGFREQEREKENKNDSSEMLAIAVAGLVDRLEGA